MTEIHIVANHGGPLCGGEFASEAERAVSVGYYKTHTLLGYTDDCIPCPGCVEWMPLAELGSMDLGEQPIKYRYIDKRFEDVLKDATVTLRQQYGRPTEIFLSPKTYKKLIK